MASKLLLEAQKKRWPRIVLQLDVSKHLREVPPIKQGELLEEL